MSISTSKLVKGEENIQIVNYSEESGFSPNICGSGDTEIFSTLIPLMTDLEVLKSCRLVCKSWNQFACRALRKLPWVYFPIDEYNPWNLDNRLKLLVENNRSGLPSPFGKFKVCANHFRSDPFLRFLKHVRDHPNNYSIELRISSRHEDIDPVELQRVFTSNLNNFKITKLELLGEISGDGPGAHIFQPENIRLPHLKHLIIHDNEMMNYTKVVLCENICQHSPLKSIKICCQYAGEKLKKIMSPGGMKSVESFTLKVEQIFPEDWKLVCARIMEIPWIKNLEMDFPDNNFKECYFEGFQAVIEHFADSLETLTGDVLPMFKTKSFTKLREINFKQFSKFNSEFSFPVGRYPLLTKATFVARKENPLDYPRVNEQSLGMEELSLKFPVEFSYSDEIMKFISAAGKFFPNVSIFTINLNGEMYSTSALLSVMCKSFPKLTALDLGLVNVDPSGLAMGVDVEEWLEKGWPFETIPRDVSLLDFPGLEKLTLGPFVSITKHLFLYCLSKMPKLQYLTFYLTSSVTATDIRNGVGHLKRITIVILQSLNYREQWVEEMERLRIMLPSVVRIRKTDREPS